MIDYSHLKALDFMAFRGSDGLMKLALIGDGLVKYVAANIIAGPETDTPYREAHLTMMQVNSNKYMIAYVREKWGINSKPIPDKHLADFFEMVLGFWSIDDPEKALQHTADYVLWAIDRYNKKEDLPIQEDPLVRMREWLHSPGS